MFIIANIIVLTGSLPFFNRIILFPQFNMRAQRSAIVICLKFLLQTIRAASLTSSATFSALDIALRLCVFALCF